MSLSVFVCIHFTDLSVWREVLHFKVPTLTNFILFQKQQFDITSILNSITNFIAVGCVDQLLYIVKQLFFCICCLTNV